VLLSTAFAVAAINEVGEKEPEMICKYIVPRSIEFSSCDDEERGGQEMVDVERGCDGDDGRYQENGQQDNDEEEEEEDHHLISSSSLSLSHNSSSNHEIINSSNSLINNHQPSSQITKYRYVSNLLEISKTIPLEFDVLELHIRYSTSIVVIGSIVLAAMNALIRKVID